jgi:hypothetical protein
MGFAKYLSWQGRAIFKAAWDGRSKSGLLAALIV